jgi:hypothetical protein
MEIKIGFFFLNSYLYLSGLDGYSMVLEKWEGGGRCICHIIGYESSRSNRYRLVFFIVLQVMFFFVRKRNAVFQY